MKSRTRRWLLVALLAALAVVGGAWWLVQPSPLTARIAGDWQLVEVDGQPPEFRTVESFRVDGVWVSREFMFGNGTVSKWDQHGRWWVSGQTLTISFDPGDLGFWESVTERFRKRPTMPTIHARIVSVDEARLMVSSSSDRNPGLKRLVVLKRVLE